MNASRGLVGPARKSSIYKWQNFALCMTVVFVPWVMFLNYHPRFSSENIMSEDVAPAVAKQQPVTADGATANRLGSLANVPSRSAANIIANTKSAIVTAVPATANAVFPQTIQAPNLSQKSILTEDLPVLGPVPTKGAVPLYGVQHDGEDAIFALGCAYSKEYYQRFVGSLRKFGYNGDIVLAVSPINQMRPGVSEYLQKTKVVAYGFEVDCKSLDNCQLKNDFLGYPDPRPHRTFANIRYALYEYWLRKYTPRSYILILDFRDTFFQGNPFGLLDTFALRTPRYDLRMFAENYKVKNIGICVFNSNWIETCFGKDALEPLKKEAVICSGSTMGSYQSISFYVRTMLKSMDSVKCWLKGIESDQGYQNYLYYNGHFNNEEGNATLFHQGEGIVNTIGALNGYRVPAAMKGPLDTHWHIRNKDGYILNTDGTHSVCVHQWDRWQIELESFVDSKLYDN